SGTPRWSGHRNAARSLFSGTIADGASGPGGLSLHVSGSGGTPLTLTGTNTYTGATTSDAGQTLQIGAGGTTGSIVSNVTNNGTLAFNRSDSVTYAGALSGGGALQQNGPGTVTLSGNNGGYTGPATSHAGPPGPGQPNRPG